MKETAVLFGARQSLVGIVSTPPPTMGAELRPAVVLLNAGLVHRTGPGRIYVKIARNLASLGFVVLRFDFSGIGDSPVRPDTLGFDQSAILETQEAMGYLQEAQGLSRFILMGGCSGAFFSFETACCDSRVVGAVSINFQMLDAHDEEDQLAQEDRTIRNAGYYYWNRALFDPKSWVNLFSGKTNYAQLMRVLWREVRRRLGAAREQTNHNAQFALRLQRLAERKVRMVFVCSQGDPRLNDLREAGGAQLKRLCKTGEVALDIATGADHTFSSSHDQERLLSVIRKNVTAITNATRLEPGPQSTHHVPSRLTPAGAQLSKH
jgi:pimeloyl-ACP methyl ester carboxylesterase